MSDLDARIKKSRRLQRDQAAISKQLKIAKVYKMPKKADGYYDKHHALDCGRSDCGLCGHQRTNSIHDLTAQERKFISEQEMWEQAYGEEETNQDQN